MAWLENYFRPFREKIIGYEQTFVTPFGEKRIVYGDWTASGRLYQPIEQKIMLDFGPFVGNTHSESSATGTLMTHAYHQAHDIVKAHVHAGPDDVIINAGFGMTAAVIKFQRILGLRIPEQLENYICLPKRLKPIIFLTHMEHHSNHTSWLTTLADVEVIKPDKHGLVDLNRLEALLKKYRNRHLKIGAFTACSNVTGIQTPYSDLARIMHENDGYCFIDFAASAPYVAIDMHPKNPLEKLDAIFFSPHKFLGGPGSSGVLLFDSTLYKNKIPDQPGGGTVDWTNPWGHFRFVSNIETREDGGTPGFLQAIKGALAVRLKEEMGIPNILKREEELSARIFKRLEAIPRLHILADHIEQRIGIFSFYADDIHYNLIVKLLNDFYGIQVRGGCSCAGTYGHYLLHVGPRKSKRITDKIDEGDLSEKPGWVRFSIHPTMTDAEIDYCLDAIHETVENAAHWSKDYRYCQQTNEFYHTQHPFDGDKIVRHWYQFN